MNFILDFFLDESSAISNFKSSLFILIFIYINTLLYKIFILNIFKIIILIWYLRCWNSIFRNMVCFIKLNCPSFLLLVFNLFVFLWIPLIMLILFNLFSKIFSSFLYIVTWSPLHGFLNVLINLIFTHIFIIIIRISLFSKELGFIWVIQYDLLYLLLDSLFEFGLKSLSKFFSQIWFLILIKQTNNVL